MLGSIGCTESFEDFNTNPKAPTPEQMEGDFASTATLISTMIPVMVQGQENNYQMIDQMIGCEYGRMTCARNHWGSDAYFATYNPSEGWGEIPFTTSMPQIYTPFFQIRDISGGEGLVYHWANLIRIFGTLRVSDCYGPVPFSKIGLGSNYQVAYDDMETLFNSMLEELDAAIPVLKESGFASVFADVDYIYGGDMTKWVKFANTLKLRLALRLVNVNPTLAQQKAEEAANDAVGLISEPADAAWSSFIPGGNSLHKINISWNEGAVSADILSYMNGYEDPRMAKYATANADGNYLGMRSGLWHRDAGNGFDKFSKPVVTEQDKLLCISASESWFSRAEGALRGWNMGGTAQYFYERVLKYLCLNVVLLSVHTSQAKLFLLTTKIQMMLLITLQPFLPLLQSGLKVTSKLISNRLWFRSGSVTSRMVGKHGLTFAVQAIRSSSRLLKTVQLQV